MNVCFCYAIKKIKKSNVGSAHCGKHEVSDLTAVSLLLPRLQQADLTSRWQASGVHLQQAYFHLGPHLQPFHLFLLFH